jgi:hypothetical protein
MLLKDFRDGGLLEQARRRQIRLYIEYPLWLMPTTGTPRQASWERGVVTSDFFGPSLPAYCLPIMSHLQARERLSDYASVISHIIYIEDNVL